jgi:integrase/recombinase XerD
MLAAWCEAYADLKIFTEENVMNGRPAKVLGPGDVRRILALARQRRNPSRDMVMVLLSVKAGLRAGEIAALRWGMVIDPKGHIGQTLELPSAAAKKGSGRRIPIHPKLRAALVRLSREMDRHPDYVVRSERGHRMTAKSVVNWFAKAYRELGLVGCSSHSGRRTFVTRAARLIMRAGGSLRDVQELAGHRSIKTTQGYIEGDGPAQRRLIRLI